jgi:hypothetical protein
LNITALYESHLPVNNGEFCMERSKDRPVEVDDPDPGVYQIMIFRHDSNETLGMGESIKCPRGPICRHNYLLSPFSCSFGKRPDSIRH